MNQLAVQESLVPAYYRDRRKNERQREVQLFAITSRGTGKILSISGNGLAFGCLYPHTFPADWLMDIIDVRGVHLKQLKVRKVWEKRPGAQDRQQNFELEVGVEFVDLPSSQKNQLTLLLRNLRGSSTNIARPL